MKVETKAVLMVDATAVLMVEAMAVPNKWQTLAKLGENGKKCCDTELICLLWMMETSIHAKL